MALGKLSDQNLAADAAISAPVLGWAAALPVANMLKEARFVEAPARCIAPEDLSLSRFDVELARPRILTLLGLMFHTLSLDALVRASVAVADATQDAPTWRSDWMPVFPRIYNSASLPWEAENWWTGQALRADIDLTKRHRWIEPPADVVAARLRFEIDDRNNEDGFFDIGGLHVSAGFSPTMNFDRGRELGVLPRDLSDETPSGRVITEPRTARRQMSASWSMLSDDDARRFFDMALRAGGTRSVVFVPDIEDELSMAREAWPATLSRLPAPRFSYAGLNSAAITLKEILA